MNIQEIESRLGDNIAAGKSTFAELLGGVGVGDEQVTFANRFFAVAALTLGAARVEPGEGRVSLLAENVRLLNAADVSFALTFRESPEGIEVTLRVASQERIQLPSMRDVLRAVSGEAAPPELPSGLDLLGRLGLSVLETRLDTGSKLFRGAAVQVSAMEPWQLPGMPKFTMTPTVYVRVEDPWTPETRRVEGDFTALLRVPGTESVTFVASIGDEFKLEGGARGIALSKVAEYLEVPLPAELPELSGSVGFTVVPARRAFSLWGEVETHWRLGGGTLDTGVDFRLECRPRDDGEGRPLVTGAFNFKATNEVALTGDLTVREFEIGFAREAEKEWSAHGGVVVGLFEKDFRLDASYRADGGGRQLRLATSDQSKGIELHVPGMESAVLKTFDFDITLLRQAGAQADGSGGGKNFKGHVDVALALPGVENVGLRADLDDDLTLAVEDLKVSLSGLAAGLGIELPREVPEITSDINLTVKRLRQGGGWEFSLRGETSVVWAFDAGRLEANAKYSLQRRQGEEKAGVVTGGFDFNATNTFSFIPELRLTKLELKLERPDGQSWSASGESDFLVFDRPLQLRAEYRQEREGRKLLLRTAAAGDLFKLEGLATLKASEFSLEIERKADGKVNWDVLASGGLEVAGVGTFSGALKLYKQDETAGLLLEPEVTTPLIIPLVPAEPKPVSLKLSPGSIAVKRTGRGWEFEAAARMALTGVPQGSLVPCEAAAVFRVDARSVSLSVENPLPAFEGKLPDIALPDLPPVRLSELGRARVQVSKVEATLSGRPSLTARLDVALPERLNQLFGERDDVPLFKLFRTYPEAVGFVFGIGYAEGRVGITFRLDSSPFEAVKIEGGVWKCDFGQFGEIDVEVPTFSFDGKDFNAHVGFEVVRELKLPLTPLKELLRRSGEGSAAALLPDALPLTDLQLIKDGKLQVGRLIPVLEQALRREVDPHVKDALGKLEDLVDKLPEALVRYLEFAPPKRFGLDAAVSATGRVNISLKLDEEHPLRLLFPGMVGPIPALEGVTLYGFSVGTLMAGSLFTFSLDAVFDQFDLASLVAGMVVPENRYLTPSKKIHSRLLARDLFTLFVIVEGVPIPVPLFYRELGLDVLGIEGVELEAHVKFPMPAFDLMELLRLASALREFVEKPARRLEPGDIPRNMNLVFTLEDVYVQLPEYLGGNLLGKRGELVRVDALGAVADLLNAVKFLTLEELIKLVDLSYRVGSADVSFLALRMQAAWLITTPGEFKAGAYRRVDIPEGQVGEYLRLLEGGSGDGVVTFLKGVWAVSDVARLDASFGLIATGAGGFATGFRVEGSVRGVIDVSLGGRVLVVRAQTPAVGSRFELDGRCRLAFLGLEVFDGGVSVRAAADSFHLEGAFRLFKDLPFNVAGSVAGTLDGRGVDVHGEAVARLGPVVLAGARATIDNTSARVSATWLGLALEFTTKLEQGRHVTDFAVNLGPLGLLSAHVEPERAVRVSATVAGIYDLRIDSTTADGGVTRGSLSVGQWGLTLVEGTSQSGPASFALTGSFHLFPQGAPLNLTAAVEGELSPSRFYLGGRVETMTILTGVLTGGRVALGTEGITLTGSLLGQDIGSVAIRHENGQVVFGFNVTLAYVFSLRNRLAINDDGRGGTDTIEASAGELRLRATVGLLTLFGDCHISLLGVNILDGNIQVGQGLFRISGGLNLSFYPFVALSGFVEGQISPQGLSLSGSGGFTSWLPLVPSGSASYRLNQDELTASVGLDFPWPVGRVGGAASFRSWRGQTCFMLAWILGVFGLDKNFIAAGPNGLVAMGIAWGSFPDDWPRDLNPAAYSVMPPPPSAFAAAEGEELPLLEIVGGLLFHDWEQGPAQGPPDGADAARSFRTWGRYQLGLSVLKDEAKPEEGYTIEVVAHNVSAEAPFFDALRAELLKVVESHESLSAGSSEGGGERLPNLEDARAVFSTTSRRAKEQKAVFTLEVPRDEEVRKLSADFDFGDPPAGYARLAALLLSPE